MKFLGWFSSALVAVGLGCGGSNNTTAGTQSATDTTSMSTSTTTETAGATTGATTDATSGATTGSSTDPTTGGTGSGMFCDEACMVDADCNLIGGDYFYSCKDNRCVQDACATDADCAVIESFGPKCAAQADCEGRTCIDIGGGVGACANAPSEDFPCDVLGYEEANYPPIEGGPDVVVCAALSHVCKDGACFNPCKNDDDCFLKAMPVCDVGTGQCRCTSDAQCASSVGLGYAVCLDGRCGCASDADCVGEKFDRCYEGTCGCSSVAACPNDPQFDGTVVVCR